MFRLCLTQTFHRLVKQVLKTGLTVLGDVAGISNLAPIQQIGEIQMYYGAVVGGQSWGVVLIGGDKGKRKFRNQQVLQFGGWTQGAVKGFYAKAAIQTAFQEELKQF